MSIGPRTKKIFVTDEQKRDLSRDSQCARGATKKLIILWPIAAMYETVMLRSAGVSAVNCTQQRGGGLLLFSDNF